MPGHRSIKPSDLADVYYDPENPAAYGSVNTLAKAAGSRREFVQEWLSGEAAYTKHRRVRKRLANDRIVVQGIDAQHSMDLADMQKYANENNGVRFLLCVVDSLSKYAWVLPLLDKRPYTVSVALSKLYSKNKRVPKTVRSDRGTEFMGLQTQNLFKKLGIKHYTADNRTKAAISERFIRTLKEKIWRHFTATGRHKYVDVLQSLVKGYNHSVHRTIGMAPADVTVYNGDLVWQKLYGHLLEKKSPNKRDALKVGQKVLIAKETGIYKKGYQGGWSSETFEIRGVREGYAGVYRYLLRDLSGENVLGTFKREELQPVRNNKRVLHKVDRRKKSEGKIPVKWRGYRKLTQWIEDV